LQCNSTRKGRLYKNNSLKPDFGGARVGILPTEKKKSHFQHKYNFPKSLQKREKSVLEVKVTVEVA
jgi:hypothetical protein